MQDADFFLGDVTLTLERRSLVEFSFLTLADSGAFLSHSPSRLNEALVLIRPFQWKVIIYNNSLIFLLILEMQRISGNYPVFGHISTNYFQILLRINFFIQYIKSSGSR